MRLQQPTTAKKIQNYIFNYNDFLGKGNFSKCYKGHHIRTNEQVAIKIVELNSLKSKRLEELLYTEIQILKKMNHPNILKCFEVLTSNRNCYIVTEYCQGGDLDDHLKKGQLSDTEISHFVGDIYEGLRYLQASHVVHRDFKIANIFIKGGNAKIADFGFAIQAKSSFKDLNIGSPLYMSPEAILHNMYSPKTDIWAFGVIIFELYHKTTPFNHCKNQDDLKNTITKQVQKINFRADLDENIKDVIVACMQIHDINRPSAQALAKFPFIKGLMQQRKVKGVEIDRKHKSKDKSFFEDSGFGNGIHRSLQKTITHDRNKSLAHNPKPIGTNLTNFNRTFNNFHNQKLISPKKNKNMNITMSPQYQPRQTEQSPHNHNIPLNIQFTSPQKANFMANNSQSPLTTHPPIPNPQQSHSLISTIVTFKQCVNLMHYLRLIFKYMSYYKEFTNLLHEDQQKHYKIYGDFLLKILDDIIWNIEEKKVRYESDNATSKQKKLKQVVHEYKKKYSKQLQSVPKKQYLKKLTDPNSLNLSLILVESHLQLNRFNELTIPPNQTLTLLKYLQTIIYLSTQILMQCHTNKNYTNYMQFKQIEETLNKSLSSFTENCLGELRMRYVGVL